MIGLAPRFASLVRRLGGAADPAPAAEALLAAWAEPSRVYHGTAHLIDCLARLDEVPEKSVGRDRVEAALWYHDAVYDPRASDNEARSAAWAGRALAALGVAPPLVGEVARLVLLTRHAEPAADPDGRLACDVDLSILGRPAAEFDAYDRAIRAEYAWVPEGAYWEGRRRVLAALLERHPLYGTEHFRRRYEDTAQANLARALASLGGSHGGSLGGSQGGSIGGAAGLTTAASPCCITLPTDRSPAAPRPPTLAPGPTARPPASYRSAAPRRTAARSAPEK